eukprot:TRINITY_DN7934_c0_g1_i1.p1 TRINITY_DN7934_c0_g1~~TRINITY_DN7934_c0_g1_i1.p1  ORF type:complete len:504 (+),score=74.19 TRINITY_DN7934_c0_g1_i1:84-1514(+)
MFSFGGLKKSVTEATQAASAAATTYTSSSTSKGVTLGPQTAQTSDPPPKADCAAQPLESDEMASDSRTSNSSMRSKAVGYLGGAMATKLKERASGAVNAATVSAVGETRAAELKDFASAAASSVAEKLANLPTRQELQEQMEEVLGGDDGGRLSELLDSALASQAFDLPTVQMAASKLARKQLMDAVKSEDRRRLRGALVASKRLHATSLPEFEIATQRYRQLAKLPVGWDVESMVRERRQGRLMARAERNDAETMKLFQKLFDGTHRAKWTRDRGDEKVPSGYDIVSVIEVQNDALWVDYAVRQEEIRGELRGRVMGSDDCPAVTVATAQAVPALPGPPLDREINEAWLFHGTTPIAVDSITADNFSVNLAGTCTGTLYGRGLYFSENCTKADEYAKSGRDKLHTMIVCRVTLGNSLYTAEVQPDPRACEENCTGSFHHSIIGDRIKCRGTFREFVVFDEAQVYANFVVQYRRRA